jgi:DNA polymerase
VPAVVTNAEATLDSVAREAAHCRRCPLYKLGTQTVFGAGPADSPVMLVGEQPGDVEDREGLPFVGPAGQMLDRALAAAGLRRDRMYVTNAVKHFKHVQSRGKRRLHQKPNAYEIDRCKWWLDLELDIIDPELTVAMGATAARALAGRPLKVNTLRGEAMTLSGRQMLVTIHPSALLRVRDSESRAAEFARFVDDLGLVGTLVPAVRL